jgi:hypothetical protein
MKPIEDYSIGDLVDAQERIKEIQERIERDSAARPGPGWEPIKDMLQRDREIINAEIEKRLPS